MKCVVENQVNELGNLEYSGCLLIAIQFLSLKLSIANENKNVIPKSTTGDYQEPVLRVNGTKGEETTSADCIALTAINCLCISQERSIQIKLEKRKECRKIETNQVSKTEDMQTTYVQKHCSTRIGTAFS